MIDAYSFVEGDIYEVKLETVQEDNSEAEVYKEKALKNLLLDVSKEGMPNREMLMGKAIEYMNLRLALGNFKHAKHYTAYTGFYIYLAVENIRKHFYPIDSKKDRQEWEDLRQKLSISRDDIQFVKDFADLVRHGSYQDVAGVDNTRILKLGANIIFKFYNYLLKHERKVQNNKSGTII